MFKYISKIVTSMPRSWGEDNVDSVEMFKIVFSS